MCDDGREPAGLPGHAGIPHPPVACDQGAATADGCGQAPAAPDGRGRQVAVPYGRGHAPQEPGGCDRAPVAFDERDQAFMREALEQARLAAACDEVPIGAVVVHDGKVVARAHNRRETDRDPSAHAEFSAMTEASRVLGRWRLTGCTVYVTLEPCLMCAGLMVNARVDRCVYGAPDPKGGAVGTLYDVSHDARLNHEFQVDGGCLEEECAQELKVFFQRRRREAKEARRLAR